MSIKQHGFKFIFSRYSMSKFHVFFYLLGNFSDICRNIWTFPGISCSPEFEDGAKSTPCWITIFFCKNDQMKDNIQFHAPTLFRILNECGNINSVNHLWDFEDERVEITYGDSSFFKLGFEPRHLQSIFESTKYFQPQCALNEEICILKS